MKQRDLDRLCVAFRTFRAAGIPNAWQRALEYINDQPSPEKKCPA